MPTLNKLSAGVLLALMALLVQGCRQSPKEKEAAFLKRGEKLVGTKQYSRAILEFRNAIQVGPNDAERYYQIGIAYLGIGDVFDGFSRVSSSHGA